MTSKYMRPGSEWNLVFTNTNGVQVPIRCAAGDVARIRANYEAKGFTYVSQAGCLEEVSNSGARLPGDIEINPVTGAIVRIVQTREE